MRRHQRSNTSLIRITQNLTDDLSGIFDSYLLPTLSIDSLVDESRDILKHVQIAEANIDDTIDALHSESHLSQSLSHEIGTLLSNNSKMTETIQKLEQMIMNIEMIEVCLDNNTITLVKNLTKTRPERRKLIETQILEENAKYNDEMNDLFREKATISYLVNQRI